MKKGRRKRNPRTGNVENETPNANLKKKDLGRKKKGPSKTHMDKGTE